MATIKSFGGSLTDPACAGAFKPFPMLESYGKVNPKLPGETCTSYIQRLQGLYDAQTQEFKDVQADLDAGLSYAEVSIKYNKTYYPTQSIGAGAVIGSIVSGVIAGGPIGGFIAAAGLAAKDGLAQAKAKKDVEKVKADLEKQGITKEVVTDYSNQLKGGSSVSGSGGGGGAPASADVGVTLLLLVAAVILLFSKKKRR